MEKVLKFICCKSYDFTDSNNVRHNGLTCKCYDEEINDIVKVKTTHLLPNKFGDDVLCKIVINGRYVNYAIAE